MVRFLVLLASVLLLVGCSDPIKEGKVLNKRHEEAREWVTYSSERRCISGNSFDYSPSNICWYDTVPNHHYDDPDWMVELEECKYDDESKLKCRRGWIEIPESRWNSISVGDKYAN